MNLLFQNLKNIDPVYIKYGWGLAALISFLIINTIIFKIRFKPKRLYELGFGEDQKIVDSRTGKSYLK